MFIKHYGINVDMIKGSGAAGGLGGGAVIFLNATIVSGVDAIFDMIIFSQKVRNCDIVITGEGKVDKQTLNGKVIAGVLGKAAL